ncbi:uncharacterized protein GGS22DRAFT_134761 [Annulohypoxylon maeteangense]|uniref:uncharacterized protein n=1 Tax=Annulohypoxylon maeteangense TaxID=1927788 RepID=UPI002007D862|nr:uncharacterized protein GGS22DRAFT_134761 [Annulohypoxylon maeteangense]KAI0885802.1 hypothetical protein GGS22DRAFT_134761 [Annulohypoxylon maeteangense]
MSSPEINSRSDLPQQKWYDVELKDILPRRGFVFNEGRDILDDRSDAILKWAIEAEVPSLKKREVDEFIAEFMMDVNAIANHHVKPNCMYIDLDGETRAKPTLAIIEAACTEWKWTNQVPRQILVDFLEELCQARSVYNMLTRIKGMPEADKGKQGRLALAIDEWNGTSPVEDPEDYYSRMPMRKIQNIIDKLLEGDFKDLGLYGRLALGEDEEDDEDSGDASDEDAPWEHNYVRHFRMKDALGSTSGFTSPSIHPRRHLLRY